MAHQDYQKKSTELLRSNEFLKRTLTAVVAAPLIIGIFASQSLYASYFLGTLTFLLVGEWAYNLFQIQKSNTEKLYWLGAGTLYIVVGVYAFHDLYRYSMPLALTILIMTWASDTGAYVIGRAVGGPKLAPLISPKKTWSGAIGGLVAAGLVASIGCYFMAMPLSINLIGLFLIIAAIGQLGDLLESAVKRYFKIKDSSRIIPGHGGFLDRLDSLLLSSLFIYGMKFLIGYQSLFNP